MISTPWDLIVWGWALGWCVLFVASPLGLVVAWTSRSRRNAEAEKIRRVNERPPSSRSSR